MEGFVDGGAAYAYSVAGPGSSAAARPGGARESRAGASLLLFEVSEGASRQHYSSPSEPSSASNSSSNFSVFTGPPMTSTPP